MGEGGRNNSAGVPTVPCGVGSLEKNAGIILSGQKKGVILHRNSQQAWDSAWALSSAGSERLPYKQRVGGSNPSAPTHWKSSTYGSFRKCFFHTWNPILKTMRKQTRNLRHKSPWFSLSLTRNFWSKSNLSKIASATLPPPVSRHEMQKSGSKHA